MRDLQVSIAEYQRARTDFGVDEPDLARHVRSCATFVQTVNEMFKKQSGRTSEYRALLDDPTDPRSDVIKGFEYARQVTNHVAPIHVDPTAVLGGVHGYRTYAIWDTVPTNIHERLTAPTKTLKPYFDAQLAGREVVDTLLDAARFYWEVCPDVVHRDAHGEWSGFPLRHQPGVSSRLHPEEPLDPTLARTWLAQRRPNGDYRVICGHLDTEHGQILYGLTFVGRCAFVPFLETPEQVRADIAAGCPYFRADIEDNTFEAGAQLGLTPGRSALCSAEPVDGWLGDQLTEPPDRPDPTMDYVDWSMLWHQESCAGAQSYMTRRERRLNASAPATTR